VLAATSHGAACPQVFPDTANTTAALARMSRRRLAYLRSTRARLARQAEDCLTLNIYLPDTAAGTQRPLPVMVFVHGESYDWGSGNLYDGRVLASRGRVAVLTLNYRLGILGGHGHPPLPPPQAS
jgi:neuroligin